MTEELKPRGYQTRIGCRAAALPRRGVDNEEKTERTAATESKEKEKKTRVLKTPKDTERMRDGSEEEFKILHKKRRGSNQLKRSRVDEPRVANGRPGWPTRAVGIPKDSVKEATQKQAGRQPRSSLTSYSTWVEAQNIMGSNGGENWAGKMKNIGKKWAVKPTHKIIYVYILPKNNNVPLKIC
ncbi:hypothetical protein M9H77_24421 [Catharanthus roseus]|uniref:Uncharacterized protein n=1 Tax=Catharanthus roseus TaxID=4058 RepID=A0ACC0AVS0_CATRO|nr:hypothetical protein M9H77_24421 [Catharanthus roseus]